MFADDSYSEASMNSQAIRHLPIALERDEFLRTLLHHLSGTLQEVVGMNESVGFISIVGQKVGDQINTAYREALAVSSLSRGQVAEVLVDLKRRIQGDFFVIEQTDEKLVLGNRACPFGEYVKGRPSLCMMTSNVFGVISAENLGYARVVLEETIAEGNDGCRVVVYFSEPDESSDDDESSLGREYFRGKE